MLPRQAGLFLGSTPRNQKSLGAATFAEPQRRARLPGFKPLGRSRLGMTTAVRLSYPEQARIGLVARWYGEVWISQCDAHPE